MMNTALLPEWFHGREFGFRSHFTTHEGTPALVLSYSEHATELDRIVIWRARPHEWHVQCSISGHGNQFVDLRTDELETAFKLKGSAERNANGEEMHAREHVANGRYIRQGRFLNIPGPGSEHWPDNAASIYIDDEIRAAVEDLIQRAGK